MKKMMPTLRMPNINAFAPILRSLGSTNSKPITNNKRIAPNSMKRSMMLWLWTRLSIFGPIMAPTRRSPISMGCLNRADTIPPMITKKKRIAKLTRFCSIMSFHQCYCYVEMGRIVSVCVPVLTLHSPTISFRDETIMDWSFRSLI